MNKQINQKLNFKKNHQKLFIIRRSWDRGPPPLH